MLTLFSASAAVVYASMASNPDGELTAVETLSMFASFGVATAVVWRARFPVAVCVGASVLAFLLPLDALAPLLALTWVIARCSMRAAAVCGAFTAAAVTVSLWRDAARDGEAVLFAINDATTGERLYLAPVGYVALGAVLVSIAVGVGLLRRAIDQSRSAGRLAAEESERAERLRSRADTLRTELTRQEERELIAREIHDTVAHQLSLLSLHAAALESTAADTQVGEAARDMRSTAHRGLEEMRTLITSLREEPDRYITPSTALTDLPRLLEQARAAGLDVTATVFASDAQTAPPSLTGAIYRIVQEALTNVVKHAPGVRAEVEVHAQPGAGAAVMVRNPLPAATVTAPDGVPGSGSGIIGMRERAESLGGTFSAQPQGSWFVVHAHLPW